tara:strand:- start:16 stop:270 length:255 start_codon:yes stop_codon:yes gene_type:complete
MTIKYIMYIRRIIYGDFGKIFISVILGLGIASLFRKTCKERKCLVFRATPMEKIKNQIFQFNNKCYTFQETATTCDKNKKIIRF